MSVFFAGRLYTTPTTASQVDDSAMANRNPQGGNTLALIGQSEGGIPNSAIAFSNATEAALVLRSGELLTAIQKAFDPSSETPAPSKIIAVRVNPAVQASLALLDSLAAPVINLVSTDYGLYTNAIKVKIESGTVSGKKVTTQLGNSYFSQDNIASSQFSIQYGGVQATAVMSINNTILVLQAPAGTQVASLDLATYNTVQKLVDRINAVASFAAVVLNGNGNDATLNSLDTVAITQDVKTALYTVTANLQAVIDWINGTSEGFVTATRAASVGTLPANIAFTYLAGGTDGTVTNTQWTNAFTVLQTQDCQWVSPVTSDASIHAMTSTHVSFMSDIARKERRAVCGGASGGTVAGAVAAAAALNSDRVSYVGFGERDYDLNGTLVLLPPYIVAAQLAGMLSGVTPGTALTNKSIKAKGMEVDLRNPTDTDPLVAGGVMAVENVNGVYKVVKSCTTWLNNKNYNRVEASTGAAMDYVSRTVREAVDALRGKNGSPTYLTEVFEAADTSLRALAKPVPAGLGILVGDANSPAYKNITVSVAGDVTSVEFECSPGIPQNFILCTIHAVPYSGTATV
jgi:hypothetical protein